MAFAYLPCKIKSNQSKKKTKGILRPTPFLTKTRHHKFNSRMHKFIFLASPLTFFTRAKHVQLGKVDVK
jgi:hypothetical protein